MKYENGAAIPAGTVVTYEVQVLWHGPSGADKTYSFGATSATQFEIRRPRTGYFTIMVRARMGEEASAWAVSTDSRYATVDGVQKGWGVYFEVPAPTEGGVEDAPEKSGH